MSDTADIAAHNTTAIDLDAARDFAAATDTDLETLKESVAAIPPSNGKAPKRPDWQQRLKDYRHEETGLTGEMTSSLTRVQKARDAIALEESTVQPEIREELRRLRPFIVAAERATGDKPARKPRAKKVS